MKRSNLQENRKRLVFKIDGFAVSDGINIYVTTNALQEFQYILDKSYLDPIRKLVMGTHSPEDQGASNIDEC